MHINTHIIPGTRIGYFSLVRGIVSSVQQSSAPSASIYVCASVSSAFCLILEFFFVLFYLFYIFSRFLLFLVVVFVVLSYPVRQHLFDLF